MKSFFYLIVYFFFIKNSCTARSLHEIIDTSKKVVDINVANNGITKGMSDIMLSDMHKDTLYIINKDKLIVVDMKSGNISTNIKVNIFLSKQLKLNKYARQIIVGHQNYYISFLNELYSISREGMVIKVYANYYFINDFEILDNSILIASRDTLKTITNNGKVLSSLPFSFTDAGYISATGQICYSTDPDDSVYEFSLNNNNSVQLKKFPPISLSKVMDEPYITCSTENYFIAFDYWKRTKVYVLKKDAEKYDVIKTIKLNEFNYAPSIAEIQREEGNPNFKIEYSNSIIYIIALWRGRLRVSSFNL